MKTWKIKNVHTESVKLVIQTASNASRGLLLNPGEFVISAPKQTPVVDAQNRRQLIEIDKSFDNDLYKFDLGKAYKDSDLESRKMIIAEEKALQYINKK